MNTNTENKSTERAIYTPKLSFYHPNAKGTGAAIQFELRPAHALNDGAIYCRLAQQNPQTNTQTFPTFDWENAIVFKLDFTAVCKIVQVLRGELELVDDIAIRTAKNVTGVRFSHRIDPKPGYLLEVSQLNGETNLSKRFAFVFNSAEALGLCEAFAGSLKEIAFGTSFEATSIAIARDAEREAK